VGVEKEDNELSILDVVRHYVEALDRYFGNVCELDLIFNFHSVRNISSPNHPKLTLFQILDIDLFCLGVFHIRRDYFRRLSYRNS
jgi:hypothetical protein